MDPVRSRDSARSKPRGKIHPGMADGKGGPPLSRTDSILGNVLVKEVITIIIV
jgi:hypothetical protein